MLILNVGRLQIRPSRFIKIWSIKFFTEPNVIYATFRLLTYCNTMKLHK